MPRRNQRNLKKLAQLYDFIAYHDLAIKQGVWNAQKVAAEATIKFKRKIDTDMVTRYLIVMGYEMPSTSSVPSAVPVMPAAVPAQPTTTTTGESSLELRMANLERLLSRLLEAQQGN